jgi:hypothetical protein
MEGQIVTSATDFLAGTNNRIIPNQTAAFQTKRVHVVLRQDQAFGVRPSAQNVDLQMFVRGRYYE